MWDLIKPLLNDILQPIQDWIRKQRWLVKVLALFGLALVIFAMTYSEHAKGAVSLTGQAVRVVWSPGDALPLHNRDQQKVRRVIDRLASDLSAKLEGGESDRGMVSCTRRLWLLASSPPMALGLSRPLGSHDV